MPPVCAIGRCAKKPYEFAPADVNRHQADSGSFAKEPEDVLLHSALPLRFDRVSIYSWKRIILAHATVGMVKQWIQYQQSECIVVKSEK